QATVKTHLLHVYDKLGVADRAAAVARAYDSGILTSGG
ncbi:MAG: DNA-binding response regulator, partial [Actinomycetota bacterium]